MYFKYELQCILKKAKRIFHTYRLKYPIMECLFIGFAFGKFCIDTSSRFLLVLRLECPHRLE